MKNKHLTLQDRQSIEQMLNAKKTFTEIARTLEKDKCTISKEVRAHVEYFRVGGNGFNYNSCKNRYHCQKTWICSTCNSPKKFKQCRRCVLCNVRCPDFEKEICPRHSKPPYVCNGCGKRSLCTLEKKVYIGNDAHEDYCQRRLDSTFTRVSATGCFAKVNATRWLHLNWQKRSYIKQQALQLPQEDQPRIYL